MSKGPHDSRTPDFKKRRDNYDKIFKIKNIKSREKFETVKPGKVRKVYK